MEKSNEFAHVTDGSYHKLILLTQPLYLKIRIQVKIFQLIALPVAPQLSPNGKDKLLELLLLYDHQLLK